MRSCICLQIDVTERLVSPRVPPETLATGEEFEVGAGGDLFDDVHERLRLGAVSAHPTLALTDRRTTATRPLIPTAGGCPDCLEVSASSEQAELRIRPPYTADLDAGCGLAPCQYADAPKAPRLRNVPHVAQVAVRCPEVEVRIALREVGDGQGRNLVNGQILIPRPRRVGVRVRAL